MDTVVFVMRILIILSMAFSILLSLDFVVTNWSGISRLRKIFFRINMFFLLVTAVTMVVGYDTAWYEIKTNLFLFLCGIVIQQLSIRKQYKNLEEKITKGTIVRFFVMEDSCDMVFGIVEIDGFLVEGFSEDIENFEKGKTYDDVSLFLKFDTKGRPLSLMVFR